MTQASAPEVQSTPPPTSRWQPRARKTPPSPIEITGSVFMMVALVCLWIVIQLLLLGGLQHDRAQQLMYQDFRHQLASTEAPLGPVIDVGDPVALVTVQEIGLDEVVVEGTASGDLLAGPGHLRNTPLPGQQGTSVVLGRATTYGAPFSRIGELTEGMGITVVMAQGTQEFTVIGVRRAGDPLPPPPEPGVARLVLVSGEGTGRLAGISPGTALYVDAEADKGFPAPAGRPLAVPKAEQVMAIDSGAWPLLALCLAALVGLATAVVLALRRWTALLVWIVAAPLVIALAWSTTDVVMRLLPNLM